MVGIEMDLKPKNSFRERLAWYRARCSTMDTREILYRLFEGAVKEYSRRRGQGWEAIKPIGTLASIQSVADRTRNCQRELAAVIVREAEDVRAGRFHLLGSNWPQPGVHATASGVLAYRP